MHRYVAITLLLGATLTAEEFTTADYPGVSKRIDFFEERMNSRSRGVRLSAFRHVTQFYYDPTEEFVGFLRRTAQDDDPVIRGYAVQKLHGMFQPIEIATVPQPIGWHAGAGEDLSAPSTRHKLLRSLKAGSTAGSTPYFSGLIGSEEFLPLLRANGRDLRDVMGLCVTARALLDCGDAEEAVRLWKRVIEQQEKAYRTDGRPGASPYYYVQACRGLIHSGDSHRLEGLTSLADAMVLLEAAGDSNSENKLGYAQASFAVATRTWVDSGEEAQRYVASIHPTRSNKSE